MASKFGLTQDMVILAQELGQKVKHASHLIHSVKQGLGEGLETAKAVEILTAAEKLLEQVAN